MKKNKGKILITGGAGYVGTALTNLALQWGYSVRAIDCLWFDSTTPLIHLNNPNYEFIYGDIRNESLIQKALTGIDFVIHTAAIVGDPASKLFPEDTKSINDTATRYLIQAAVKQEVSGFIFLSTCSNYGVANDLATEETSLNPLSLYAETKVNIEKYLINEVTEMDWIIGRLSTVYGEGARMRFDLTVNDFTLNAYLNKYVDIFFPESYRPYIHVYDLANVLLTLLGDLDTVKNNVFNIGFEGENYQKIEIANTIKEFIPDLTIDILKEGGDKRDYQVAFSKLQKFISIKPEYNVKKSVQKILTVLEQGIIENPKDDKYYNTSPNNKVLKTVK